MLNLVNCWKHCWQTNKLCHNFFCLVRKIQVQPTVIWVMPAKKCLVLICTENYHKSQELPVKGVLKNRLKMEINVLVLLLSKFLALQKINMNQQYKQYTINVRSLWPSLIGVTFCQILLISVINCHFQRWKTYSCSLQISVFLFLVFLLYLAKNLRLSFSNFFKFVIFNLTLIFHLLAQEAFFIGSLTRDLSLI